MDGKKAKAKQGPVPKDQAPQEYFVVMKVQTVIIVAGQEMPVTGADGFLPVFKDPKKAVEMAGTPDLVNKIVVIPK